MTAMGRSAVAVAKWALSTIVSVHFSVRYSEVRPCASLAAHRKTARARERATACCIGHACLQSRARAEVA